MACTLGAAIPRCSPDATTGPLKARSTVRTARTVGGAADRLAGSRSTRLGGQALWGPAVAVLDPMKPCSVFRSLPGRRAPWWLLALPLAACVAPPPRHPHPAPAPRPVEQTLYFYPAHQQSESQQDRDRYECYRWAVRETNVDPGMRPLRQTAQPVDAPVARDPGATVGGAVAGAAVGGIVSSPRNVGTGLVLGAVIGGLLGSAAEESRAQAEERRQEYRRDAWEARQAPLNDFRRAMSACMTGRGYSVR